MSYRIYKLESKAKMACLRFYRSIGEVIYKIHLIRPVKLKFMQIKRDLCHIYRFLHVHDFFCGFFMNYN